MTADDAGILIVIAAIFGSVLRPEDFGKRAAPGHRPSPKGPIVKRKP